MVSADTKKHPKYLMICFKELHNIYNFHSRSLKVKLALHVSLAFNLRADQTDETLTKLFHHVGSVMSGMSHVPHAYHEVIGLRKETNL